MECAHCGVARLSQEFPHATGEACAHPSLWCLECCINSLKSSPVCPECLHSLTKADVELLCADFTLITQSDKFLVHKAPVSHPSTCIIVTKLSGEHYEVPFNSSMFLTQLHIYLHKITGIPVDNQRIVFNKTDLKIQSENGKYMTLGDYQVQPGNILQLMHILYSISSSSSLKNVVFDLYWGYPASGPDFLDATCIIYHGENWTDVIDYIQLGITTGAKHSGDVMDPLKRQGHHTIDINLQALPTSATCLFFVLSAFICNDIALFSSPSVKMVDKSNPNQELCKYNIKSVGSSQAVVMCYLIRYGNGWRVVVADKRSAGNVQDYSHIYTTIAQLFASGLIK